MPGTLRPRPLECGQPRCRFSACSHRSVFCDPQSGRNHQGQRRMSHELRLACWHGPQMVFGGGNRAHGAKVLNDRAGPQRSVLSGARVLIPTAASTGLPNRPRHVLAKIGGEVLLRFGANFHHADVAFAHQLQALDDVADLRLNHQHDGIVAQAGVGAEKNEKIRKTADRHAEIGAQAVAPGVVNLEAPAAKQLHADELLGDMEPGAINQYVDRTLRTVLRNDAMLPNLGNSIRDKFYVTALKHGIKIVGKKNALATNLITRRQRGLQCGIGDTAFKVTARDPFYVFANDAVAKKIEHAPFEREEKKFANEPGEHRDAAKALAPFLRDAKVEARNDPGRRALKNIKLADARSDVRNELNGARAGADDPDRFTTQVHVGAPRCGMKRRPGETLDARDFRVVRNMERAHAGNQDTRADGHRFCESAVVAGDLTRGDLPAATFV